MICLIVLAVGSGLAAGMILTVLSLRYGIRGSFFFLAALVPQQAVLVPGYCMLLEWCLHKTAASGVWISLAVIGIGCAQNVKSRYGGTGISRTAIWYYLKICRKIA